MLAKIASIPRLLDDTFDLSAALASPTTIVLVIGEEDGLVYGENVGRAAYTFVHIVVFRRRRVKDLDETLKALIPWAFNTFHMDIIAAWIPDFNKPARWMAERMGLRFDGILRGFGVYSGGRVDLHVYSIAKDEVS